MRDSIDKTARETASVPGDFRPGRSGFDPGKTADCGASAPPAGREVLRLYVPKPEDLWFYARMHSDPATMSYNAPWFPPDGCVPFPESERESWYARTVGREPLRFYAYLRRDSDGAFVGGVNYHYVPEQDWWDMGVLIYAPERGKGYGSQGLRLLLDRAFRTDGVRRLHNCFETTREAACHIHLAADFRLIGLENGLCQLELTREEYLTR